MLILVALVSSLTCVWGLECFVCTSEDHDGDCDEVEPETCSAEHVLPALLMLYPLDYIENNVTSYVLETDNFLCLKIEGNSENLNLKYCMYDDVNFCGLYHLWCGTCSTDLCNMAGAPRVSEVLRKVVPVTLIGLMLTPIFNFNLLRR